MESASKTYGANDVKHVDLIGDSILFGAGADARGYDDADGTACRNCAKVCGLATLAEDEE